MGRPWEKKSERPPLTRSGEESRNPQEAQRWDRKSREAAVSRVNLRKHTWYDPQRPKTGSLAGCRKRAAILDLGQWLSQVV